MNILEDKLFNGAKNPDIPGAVEGKVSTAEINSVATELGEPDKKGKQEESKTNPIPGG